MRYIRNVGIATLLASGACALLGSTLAARADSAPATSSLGEAETPALAKSCSSELGVNPFDSFRKVKHCLEAWTEYFPATCKPDSSGSYAIAVAPKHGALSFGTISGSLGGGLCPGKKFTFAIAYYTWTDLKVNDPQDAFTIVWKTPDGLYNYSFPMIAKLAPRITGTNVVWWLNGQKPPGYATTTVLTAAPSGLASYTWKVAAGTTKVKLLSTKTTTNTATSAKGSTALNDVSITVTANGGVSNPFTLTVEQPKTFSHLTDVDTADPTYGYDSQMNYEILDQFGKVLPADIPVNEHWTSPVVADFAKMNWQREPNLGAVLPPSGWADEIKGATAGHKPPSQSPNGGTTKVFHWTGDWRVGSTATVGNKGVLVQSNTFQMYEDHARHTNVVSPSAEADVAPAPAGSEP